MLRYNLKRMPEKIERMGLEMDSFRQAFVKTHILKRQRITRLSRREQEGGHSSQKEWHV